MWAVRVRGRHFNGRQPSDLTFQQRDESSSEGWGAYARDKNTSARLCAKNAGGLMRKGDGVFAGHYGTCVFLGFICTSQLTHHLCRTCKRHWSLNSFSAISTMSSPNMSVANKKTPQGNPTSSLLIWWARSLMKSPNNMGDKIQPCFVPLSTVNQSYSSLFTLTQLRTSY